MIYYVGSVFITRPDGCLILPVVWRFQVDSIEAFKTMALGVATENLGEGVQVEFGTIGVSKYSHK
jgi:hypothetical protein